MSDGVKWILFYLSIFPLSILYLRKRVLYFYLNIVFLHKYPHFYFDTSNNYIETDWATNLDGGVSTFQQGDGQQDALLEDSVAGGVHDEVDDQIRSSLFVQVTLYLGQAHLSSTQASDTPES